VLFRSFPAIFQNDFRFEKTGTDRIDELEGLTSLVEVLSKPDALSDIDEFVQAGHFLLGKSEGQTEFPQVAVGTCCLDDRERNVLGRCCVKHPVSLWYRRSDRV
jgi:hypothetical protein